MKLFLIIPIFSLIGCALLGAPSNHQAGNHSAAGSQSSRFTKTFNEDFESVWSAILVSLGDMPLDKINKEKGIIRTGWVEGLSQRQARGVITDRFLDDYWKERYRLTFTISGNDFASSVKVSGQLQQKARGGSMAYRWEPLKSTGEMEEGALMRIEEILTEGL